jgi:bifunctional non-homologous end joining protein LigD
MQSECFVIIGYKPCSSALAGIGRLFLAAQTSGGLVYVGDVDTGAQRFTALALRWMMDRLVVSTPAVKLQLKQARWVAPQLVAEIAFYGWTDDVKLCGASFKRLHEAASKVRVYRVN